VRPGPRVVHHIHQRPWYAAAAIVAAVICLVASVTAVASNRASENGFSGQPTSSPTVIATDTSEPSPTTPPGTPADDLLVYYLGPGPQGAVLYPETVPSGDDPIHTASLALMTGPRDPDYRTKWGPGSILSASLKHGVVEVELGAMRAQRPQTMSSRTANEIVQQAIWTFRAASGRHDAKVQFLRNERPAVSVLGVAADHPLEPGRVTQVLSLMSINSPAEGQELPLGRFDVTGTNNGNESNVILKLVRSTATGDEVVLTANGTAEGNGGDQLYSWSVPIDTRDLSPGSYTLVASNDDLSGGGEGFGPAQDTRTIVLN
jgi:Immunoglobulin-like domain of bacterial spore germination/Sporulation and spore germination